ncbi:MAG: transposase [Opitutaceae bacterium]|nr:transposase [Cytophagales bacterium]
MERYVKTYKSKWQNQYTEEFKRSICEEFLKGTATLRSVERKYQIGNSRLNHWLIEFGYKVKKPYILETTVMAPASASL